jgi:hypothetical protein
MECGGTGVFDHDAALDGGVLAQGKAVSPLLRRSATALQKMFIMFKSNMKLFSIFAKSP